MDTVNLVLSESLNYASNLFELPDGVNPASGSTQSERSSLIRTESVGIKLNKAYAQQRLRLETSIDKTHYDNFSYLDYTGHNAAVYWDWKITPRLTGLLLANQKQTLASFSNNYGNTSQRNLQTNDNRYYNLDYWAVGGWHAVTSVGNYSSVVENNSVVAENAYKAKTADAGVKYIFGSNSAITYLARKWDGDYPYGLQPANLLDTNFKQYDHEMKATWVYSDQTMLVGRLTSIKRRHPDFSQRDYSGNTGRLDATWTPTGKTAVVVGISQDISSYPTNYSNYITTDSITLSPTWYITEKTSLLMIVKRSSRNYQGEPFGPVATREDYQNTARFGLNWKATRNVDLTADLQHDNRTSTYAGNDFDGNQVSLKALLNF